MKVVTFKVNDSCYKNINDTLIKSPSETISSIINECIFIFNKGLKNKKYIQILEREVKNSGRIYIPFKFIGRKVNVGILR